MGKVSSSSEFKPAANDTSSVLKTKTSAIMVFGKKKSLVNLGAHAQMFVFEVVLLQYVSHHTSYTVFSFNKTVFTRVIMEIGPQGK